MIKKEMKKKIISLTVVSCLMVSIFNIGSINAKANEVEDFITQNDKAQEEILDCIDELEDSSVIEFVDNQIIYDEEELAECIEDIDISAINKMCEEYNMGTYTEETLLEAFKEGIDFSNEKLNNDELTMLQDGSMIESDDDSFYLQGGSTYDKTYWWGKMRYKSTAAANRWVRDLNKGAASCGGIGVIGSLVGVAPSVVGGIGCWILWDMAAEVDYYNGLSNRGIKAKIPWCIVGYKVSKQ